MDINVDEYIKEEELCGHRVTSVVKKTWLVQISLMRELQRICEKHEITYFVGGGTLLGCVRHKGFIPWDDDMDVFMLAADYEKFCSVAPLEVSSPFFFQHYTTQKDYGMAMSRLRRSDTTGCTDYELKKLTSEYNAGIFIDIFPLHFVTNNKIKLAWKKFSRNFWGTGCVGFDTACEISLKGNTSSINWKKRICLYWWKILRPFVGTSSNLQRKFYKACISTQNSDRVGLITFFGYNEKYIWPLEFFSDVISLPFEMIHVNAPIKYHEVLQHQFGDYQKYVKGGACHTMAVQDPDIPYKEKFAGVFKK